jgi:two-component system KDP operon response regulator KdpE
MTPSKPRILVVDDEPQIRRFLRTGLTTQGYDMIEAVSCGEALQKTMEETPDLIILDLGLPDGDGSAIIPRLRQRNQIPVIVLSARFAEADKIQALDHGADDYVTKPFGVGELLARIRTALRHKTVPQISAPELALGHVRVDFERRLVTSDNIEVHLSRKEYDILRLLATNAGRVLTHQHLLREVWGGNFTDQTQYLRVYIGQLRQKLERDPTQPELILTEPGVGYRLRPVGE